jgi:putative tricarboxylic transport membrane protein
MDRAAIAIALALLALAGLIVWQAGKLPPASGYGLGPSAMMYLVAAGLALAGFGHLAKGKLPHRDAADWHAVAWIGGGLATVMMVILVGGGFVLAMALLFAATARGFGRRALLVDLLIGVALALVVYLLFTKLLTLGLPQGPLERLL